MAAVEQAPEAQQRGKEREQPKEQFLVDEEYCTSLVRLVVEQREDGSVTRRVETKMEWRRGPSGAGEQTL